MVLFRGQTIDRPLVTSIHRSNATEDSALIPDMHFSWSEFAANALSYLGHNTDRRSDSAMAVLQHYGARSYFLDVTHDATVALWFALNHFAKAGTALLDETADPHLFFYPLLTAAYLPANRPEGFVYVIAVPRGMQSSHLIDLDNSLPPHVLRVHRQRGALLANRDGQVNWGSHPSLTVCRLITAVSGP